MRELLSACISKDETPEAQRFHYAALVNTLECLVLAVFAAVTGCYAFMFAMLFAALVAWCCHMLTSRGVLLPVLYGIYFGLLYIFMVPFLYYTSKDATCIFFAYLVTGILYVVLMLRGGFRIFFVIIQAAVTLVCIYLLTAVDLVYRDELLHQGVILYIEIMAAILVTGIVGGLLVAYRNQEIRARMEERMALEKEAEETSYSKDMFLVNVSHEIRTPLNAILGTAELLEGMDASDAVKEDVLFIANASRALLSITNDLMDFSRIEGTEVEITEAPYEIGALVNDLVNMFSFRFADSSLALFTDIDPNLPVQIIGDGPKIKQILLNRMTDVSHGLSGGYIKISVLADEKSEGHLQLTIIIDAKGYLGGQENAAPDTGYIDRQEMQAQKDRLYQSMVEAMNGTEEFADGAFKRSYRFSLAQRYETDEVLSKPGSYGDTRFLVYENTENRQKSFEKALKKMEIPFVTITKNEEFFRECKKEEYTHIVLAAERFDAIKEQLNDILPPHSLILVKTGMFFYEGELVRTTLNRPVNCLTLDALLSGKSNYAVRQVDFRGNFVCPEARIMVVDDNLINLEVASEMLKKYQAKVLTVASGKDALNLLEDEPVDLIFLDYMMPEMDGIDTLKNIRAMSVPGLDTVPIIALTANAVSGAREMFVNAGFDEYVSKPIEIDKFEKALRTYLPPEKIVFVHKEDAT